MNVLIFNHPAFHGLQWSLESIKTHSPNSTVHILDGKSPHTLADQFEKIYHHQSINPKQDVLRSFTRWMVMLEYCHVHNIGEFFTCDSDVLIFCDIETNRPNLPMSGHTGLAYVRNLATFNKFIQAMFEFYEKGKWKFYKNSPNVSDMTVWDEFFEQRDAGTMFHCGNPMWDANMGLSQGLDMDGNHKRIAFINGLPRGERNGKFVRLMNLHCWGESKPKMKEIWEASMEVSNG